MRIRTSNVFQTLLCGTKSTSFQDLPLCLLPIDQQCRLRHILMRKQWHIDKGRQRLRFCSHCKRYMPCGRGITARRQYVLCFGILLRFSYLIHVIQMCILTRNICINSIDLHFYTNSSSERLFETIKDYSRAYTRATVFSL